MKKAAIITLYGNYNFGNKLQNYALQAVLEDYGFEVETLIFSSAKSDRASVGLSDKFKKKIKKINYRTIKRKINSLIYRAEIKKIKRLRESKFKDFSDKHICTRYISDSCELSILSQEFDCFVIGSDQVWNPEYINSFEWSFALFANESQRIVYAASLGVDKIPERYLPQFTKSLQGLKNISLREEQAKIILWEQCHVDSTVVLDPTLLISKERWEKLIDCSQKEKPYILTYFLGGNTKYPQSEINNMCRNKTWEIIDFNSLRNNMNYISGPVEFLKYIKGARLILTDSFHGAVFSIIFHTPFVVFKRDNQESGMYQRLEQLLNTFHLMQRQYCTGTALNAYLTCDFMETEKILYRMREKSLKYLEDAIKSV